MEPLDGQADNSRYASAKTVKNRRDHSRKRYRPIIETVHRRDHWATTAVTTNHNRCHALTSQYSEVPHQFALQEVCRRLQLDVTLVASYDTSPARMIGCSPDQPVKAPRNYLMPATGTIRPSKYAATGIELISYGREIQMRRTEGRISMAMLCLGAVFGGCAGGVISTLLFQGHLLHATETPRAPSITSAEEFRLVDQDGKLRAVLGLSIDKQPYLAFLDSHEIRRVWLGIGQESGVAVRDIDGKTRLVLSVGLDGEPSLVVRDRQHQSRIFQP